MLCRVLMESMCRFFAQIKLDELSIRARQLDINAECVRNAILSDARLKIVDPDQVRVVGLWALRVRPDMLKAAGAVRRISCCVCICVYGVCFVCCKHIEFYCEMINPLLSRDKVGR